MPDPFKPIECDDDARVRAARRTLTELLELDGPGWQAWLALALPGLTVSGGTRTDQILALQLLGVLDPSPTGLLVPATWAEVRSRWHLTRYSRQQMALVRTYGVAVDYEPPDPRRGGFDPWAEFGERRRQKGGV